MPQFLQAAKGVIVAASANPLALAALLLLLVTWLLVALKVNRNKQLLQNLNKLPQKDRLRALQAEMGVVQIKGGLSPEEWLKNKVRTCYLIGFAMMCVTAIVLAAMAINSRSPALRTGLSVTLNAANTATASPVAEQDIPPERTVTYESILQDGVPRIQFRLPYRDLLARGGPVSGMNYLGSPFRWRYPELSVKVVNNSVQNMVLSQAIITILSSRIEREPVPLFEDMSVNRLVIRDEGWGPMADPVVSFSVSEARASGEVSLFAEQRNTVKLETFDTVARIPLPPYLPNRLKNESLVSVSGSMTYGAPDSRKTLQFKTRVSLQVRAAASMAPSHCYDVHFDAGQAPITRQVPLAQQIKPGEADNFLLRLATDKTSTTRARIDFVTAGKEKLLGGEFQIEIFVPRTTGKSNPCGG